MKNFILSLIWLYIKYGIHPKTRRGQKIIDMPELTLQALYLDSANIDKVNRRKLQILLDRSKTTTNAWLKDWCLRKFHQLLASLT